MLRPRAVLQSGGAVESVSRVGVPYPSGT